MSQAAQRRDLWMSENAVTPVTLGAFLSSSPGLHVELQLHRPEAWDWVELERAPLPNDEAEAPGACPADGIEWGPRFTLAELVDQEAMAYAAWGNDLGQLLSRTMNDLSAKIRYTGAQTVAEYDARNDLLEQWTEQAADLGRMEPDLPPYDLLP